MAFRLVPALVLAAVCGCGVVDAADNLVFPHISRVNGEFGPEYHIFYNFATTHAHAETFCRDTGGKLLDIFYLPNYHSDSNLAIFSFLKQSMHHNLYVWLHGQCCFQHCLDEQFEQNDGAFDLGNRVFDFRSGSCVNGAWRRSNEKLSHLPDDSTLAPEFACTYAPDAIVDCPARVGHPELYCLQGAPRGICLQQTNITTRSCLCFEGAGIHCTDPATSVAMGSIGQSANADGDSSSAGSFIEDNLALVLGAACVVVAVTVGVALYSQRRAVNRLRGKIARQRRPSSVASAASVASVASVGSDFSVASISSEYW